MDTEYELGQYEVSEVTHKIPSEYTDWLQQELDQIQKQVTALLKEIAKWTKKEGN